MKAFVTGGSGLIGLPLVEKLLDQGYEVVVLDLHKPTIEHDKLSFVQKSIMDELAEDMKGCDVIFHFAALLGVDNSDGKPLETLKVNLEGSVNIFKSAMEAGVKHVIFSSSSEIYGNPRELPIKETTPKGPVSTYGVSKLASEMYAQAFNHEFGMNIKIVRFFNVYGPRQVVQFVLPIFVSRALKGEEITVFGDGSQTRCFTYVDDAVDGILAVMEKGTAGEAYNIGNNRPTTMLELAETIKEATGSSSEINVAGYGENTRKKEREVEYRIPDISKIQALGWKPKVFVHEGIAKVATWLKEN